MPKTAVKTAVCDICGAEVRGGSAFCYNCGGSLMKEAEPEPIPPPAGPIAELEHSPLNGRVTAVDSDAAKRKAERSGRRKVSAAAREPVEIVWEPREGVSWTFVVASILFVIIALAVVIAAVYVR